MKTNRILAATVLVLGLVAAGYYFSNRNSTLHRELSDFAVQDTASIDSVFLADKQGNSVLLTRQAPGRWLVNHGPRARNDMVNTLLATMKNLDVRSPVAKAAFNNVMKKLAATAIKVEIYRGGGSDKTYYVGHETQDQYGTFMYMEHSSVPFIMHIPGFDGFLTTRYTATADDWIPQVVFDFDVDEIVTLVSDNREQADASFLITRGGDGGFVLQTFPGREAVAGASRNKIITYLGYFGNLNYEFMARDLPGERLDSIRQTPPFLVLTLHSDAGRTRKAALYRMPRSKTDEELREAGIVNTRPYDTDRFYVRLDGGDVMYACQYYSFGKLFIRPESLLE